MNVLVTQDAPEVSDDESPPRFVDPPRWSDLLHLYAFAVAGHVGAMLAAKPLPEPAFFWVKLASLVAACIAFARLSRVAAREVIGLRLPPTRTLVAAVLGVVPVAVAGGLLVRLLSLGLGGSDFLVGFGMPSVANAADALEKTIGAPLAEELLWRGAVWFVLARLKGDRFAWAVTTVGFALTHLQPAYVLYAGIMGVFLGWLRLRSGSVFPSLLAHILVNSTVALLALQ